MTEFDNWLITDSIEHMLTLTAFLASFWHDVIVVLVCVSNSFFAGYVTLAFAVYLADSISTMHKGCLQKMQDEAINDIIPKYNMDVSQISKSLFLWVY